MVAKVMIAEDDATQILNYEKILSKDENIKVIGFSQDGLNAIEMYQKLKPDILLLDLGLPKMNGLEVINKLSTIEKDKCNIIVISGNNDLRYNLFNTKKVFRIIPKPTNFDVLLEAVEEMKTDICNNINLDDLINNIFIDFKLNPYNNTSILLKHIIKIGYANPEKINNLNKLYKQLSFSYQFSNKKIESKIRSSINTIKKAENKSAFKKYLYMYDESVYKYITPKIFICGIISYITKETKD